MTTDEIISRCYEHGQPDYILAADRLKELQSEIARLSTSMLEVDDLCELLRQFIMEFWIDKPQMTWKRARCEDGLEMVHHDGGTIFFGDPNHKDPSDAARFDLIVQLANATPQLLRSLTTEPKRS